MFLFIGRNLRGFSPIFGADLYAAIYGTSGHFNKFGGLKEGKGSCQILVADAKPAALDRFGGVTEAKGRRLTSVADAKPAAFNVRAVLMDRTTGTAQT